MRAIAADALPHRAHKILGTPQPNSSFIVRRDIWRDDLAEWRFDRQSAGKWLASRLGMAGGAIAHHRKVASPLDLAEILTAARSRHSPECRRTKQCQQCDVSKH
jgi:hypothetical protein